MRIFSPALFALILIACLHGITHTFYNMLGPVYISIQKHFNFSAISQVSLLGTVFLAFYGCFNLLWGVLSDKTKKVYIIGWGTILAGIAFIFIGFVNNYPAMLIIIALAGASSAVYHPVGTALTTIMFKNKMGTALGISGFGATLGLFGAPILSGWIAKHLSWQTSFKTIGITAIFFGICFLLWVKEPPKSENPQYKSGINHWNKKLIIWLFIITGIMIFREFCGWGAMFLIPIYAQKVLNCDPFRAGIMAGTGIVGGLICGPLAGYLSDKYNRKKLLFWMLIILAASAFTIPFIQNSYIFLILFIFGCAYSASVPVLDSLIGRDAPDHIKGSIFGITITAGMGISALAPWILAKIIDNYSGNLIWGFKLCFWVLSCSIIIAIVFLGIYGLKKAGFKPSEQVH